MAGSYDALGLYHDPDDSRLLVPKRIRAMGWTLNVSHRHGPIALIAVGILIGSAVTAALLGASG